MIEILNDVGLSPEAHALAQGMLLGDKTEISREMLQQFRTAGMSHILAVSGLHVGVIMSLVWLLLKPLEWLVLLLAPVRMATYYVLGDVKRLLTIVITILYVWRIGAPPSAVRAATMLSLCLIGWMIHRPTSAWRCMALAALCLLAWDPWTALTPGFQLSFLAVGGILMFQPWLQSRQVPGWLRLLLLSVAAQWFAIPVVAYWFHQVPFLGFVQGILVVPLLPLFVALILMVMIFPSWHFLAMVVNALTSWMGEVAHGIDQCERLLLGGHLYFYPALWEVFFYELLLLALILYLRLRQQQRPSLAERKEKLRQKLNKQSQ